MIDTTLLPTSVRSDFPILQRKINGHRLIYLDSAATAQKPTKVINSISNYYGSINANVHRGVHWLGNEATDAFEEARQRVAKFIDADPKGIVFVRNTTEAINLVASSYAQQMLKPKDRIVLTEMEHHSNIVPWQLAAQRADLSLSYIAIHENGTLDMEHAAQLIDGATKLVSVTHQSNVLGTINPVRQLAGMAHAHGALFCVDAAQSVPHFPVSVRDLDCDFLAFSGHKMCGPMGVGVLWARPELLEAMSPFLGGGSMIFKVNPESSTWNSVPHKFEAGTPDVASAVGLAAACDYLDNVGMGNIHQHERALTERLLEVLSNIPNVQTQGPKDPDLQGGTVSFTMDSAHAHDVGTVVDAEGIAIRAGHHCCQILMRKLGVPATARASAYLYNTIEEIDALGAALEKVNQLFAA